MLNSLVKGAHILSPACLQVLVAATSTMPSDSLICKSWLYTTSSIVRGRGCARADFHSVVSGHMSVSAHRGPNPSRLPSCWACVQGGESVVRATPLIADDALCMRALVAQLVGSILALPLKKQFQAYAVRAAGLEPVSASFGRQVLGRTLSTLFCARSFQFSHLVHEHVVLHDGHSGAHGYPCGHHYSNV